MRLKEAIVRIAGGRARLRRFQLDMNSVLGGTDYSKFLIVGTARTGSTLLVDALNEHSQCLAFGEIFRSSDAIGWDIWPFAGHGPADLLSLYRSDPVRFLSKAIFRRWPKDYRAIGFKLFYYHARQPPFSSVWDYLRDPSIRVLHLMRRNLLEQYLSLQLAHKTNVWSTTRALERDPAPINLDASACLAHFASVEKWQQDCATFFADQPVKEVFYEDLAGDLRGSLREITDFLGIAHEDVRTKFVRQRNSPISRAIANYDELKSTFARTKWEVFFEQHEWRHDANIGIG
jgi:LPS sulfotransferase NodH